MQGRSELEQISIIFGVLGTPNEDNWPNWRTMPDANKLLFEPKEPRNNWTEIRMLFLTIDQKKNAINRFSSTVQRNIQQFHRVFGLTSSIFQTIKSQWTVERAMDQARIAPRWAKLSNIKKEYKKESKGCTTSITCFFITGLVFNKWMLKYDKFKFSFSVHS